MKLDAASYGLIKTLQQTPSNHMDITCSALILHITGLIRVCSIALMLIGSLWLAVAQAQDNTSKNDSSKSSTVTINDPSDKGNSENLEKNKDELWIDHVQYALSSTVDATARWVDRFFADPRFFDDRPTDKKLAPSVGRLMVGPRWDQADGWDAMFSLRARHYLPHLNNRFSAVIGRLGFDEFISGDDAISQH